MGIYSNYSLNSNGSEDRETLDMIMMDESVLPYDADNEIEAGFDIIYTMNENYNAICYHIGVNELTAIEETGTPLVYTESVFSSIFNAIKNFLKKIWERIKALFKRFMMIIHSYSKTDKEFINKYRKDIFAVKDLSDFTFKGYKWDIDSGKIGTLMKSFKDKANATFYHVDDTNLRLNMGDTKDIEKKLENFEDECEKIRGEELKKVYNRAGSSLTIEEFRKDLKAWFRNGEDEKEELSDKEIDVHDMVTELQGSKDLNKTINDIFKANKKSIEESQKHIDQAFKEHIKNEIPVKDPDGKIKDPSHATKPISTSSSYDEKVKWLQQNDYVKGKDIGPNGKKGMWIPKKFDMNQDFSEINSSNADFIEFTDDNEIGMLTEREVNMIINYVVASGISQYQLSGKEMTNKENMARKSKRLNLLMKMIKFDKETVVIIDTEAMNALKERSRQYKACLTKIVAYRPKKESFLEESYSEDMFNESSSITNPFDNIVLK